MYSYDGEIKQETNDAVFSCTLMLMMQPSNPIIQVQQIRKEN